MQSSIRINDPRTKSTLPGKNTVKQYLIPAIPNLLYINEVYVLIPEKLINASIYMSISPIAEVENISINNIYGKKIFNKEIKISKLFFLDEI